MGARAQRGLTLVELLVVMAILALATGVVIVNAPPSRDQLRLLAEDFEQGLRDAADQAVITGASYRLEVEPAAAHIARLDDGEWARIRSFPGPNEGREISVRIEIEEAAGSNRQALTGAREVRRERDDPVLAPIDPLGEMSEFSVFFQRGVDEWRVRHDRTGAMEASRT